MTSASAPASRWPFWTLSGILGAAAAVRLIGLGFGLPAVYNPDEVAIMSRALAFAKGDLNPHNFLYPTFYFYVLFAWIGGYFVVGRVLGWHASLAAFQTRFFVDPTGVFLAGRSLGVACGLGGVALSYPLARRVGGRAAALAASLFLATAPFHARDSHYVKHDVPVTLAIIAAALLALRLAEGDADAGRRRRLVLAAGAAGGLACATHYFAVFLALPLAMALLFPPTPWPARVRDVAWAAVAAAVAFFVCSPFVVLDAGVAIRDIVANRQIVVDRAVNAGGVLFGSAPAYLAMLVQDAIGWPVVALALGGFAVSLRRSRRRTLILVAFPVAFFLFISNTVPASRYLVPVLPFLAVLAGVGTEAMAGWLARRRGWARAATGVCTLVLAAAASAPGLVASVRTGLFFQQTDTRTLALAYIERTIPPGASIAIQPYSVPLVQSRESLIEALDANVGGAERASAKFRLRLDLEPYPQPAYRTLFIGDGGLDADKIYVSYGALGGPRGLGALRALGVTYVVLKRYNRPHPDSVPLLKALAGEAQLVATFSPYRAGLSPAEIAATEPYLHNTDVRLTAALARPGPVVEVWRLHSAFP